MLFSRIVRFHIHAHTATVLAVVSLRMNTGQNIAAFQALQACMVAAACSLLAECHMAGYKQPNIVMLACILLERPYHPRHPNADAKLSLGMLACSLHVKSILTKPPLNRPCRPESGRQKKKTGKGPKGRAAKQEPESGSGTSCQYGHCNVQSLACLMYQMCTDHAVLRLRATRPALPCLGSARPLCYHDVALAYGLQPSAF